MIISQKACLSEARTKVQIVRGRYQHTKNTSGPYKQYNSNFKSMFLFFSPYFVLLMVEGDWLKMLCRRKFTRLKTADEEKALMKVRNFEANERYRLYVTEKREHTQCFLPFDTPIRKIGFCPEQDSNPHLPDY